MRCAELLPSLLQLLAVIDQRSHLGFCRTSSLCHCGKEIEVTNPYHSLHDLVINWRDSLYRVIYFSLRDWKKRWSVSILLFRWTLAFSYPSPGLYLGSAGRATKFTEMPMQSSMIYIYIYIFLPLLKRYFQSNKFNPCSQCEVCVLFQAHCKGSGCASSNTGHFLDLWRPRCQFTLLGIPLHFCHL